jgi:hypothetical protein
MAALTIVPRAQLANLWNELPGAGRPTNCRAAEDLMIAFSTDKTAMWKEACMCQEIQRQRPRATELSYTASDRSLCTRISVGGRGVMSCRDLTWDGYDGTTAVGTMVSVGFFLG